VPWQISGHTILLQQLAVAAEFADSVAVVEVAAAAAFQPHIGFAAVEVAAAFQHRIGFAAVEAAPAEVANLLLQMEKLLVLIAAMQFDLHHTSFLPVAAAAETDRKSYSEVVAASFEISEQTTFQRYSAAAAAKAEHRAPPAVIVGTNHLV